MRQETADLNLKPMGLCFNATVGAELGLGLFAW